jgi:hypothetical protein
MAEEKELQNMQTAEKVEERSTVSVEQGSASLVKYGGFAIVETTIDGAQNLNPEKKARKKIFLSESEKKQEREKLKKRLALILDLLASAENVPALIEQAQGKADAAQTLLNKNILKALDATKELEQSYRSVNFFFKNTGSDKVKNVYFMNAEKAQLNDLDNTIFIDAVNEELAKNYDRLDLRDNFSILAIPGYLGSKKVIDKWARIAYKNKVMLLTDFQNFEGADDVLEEFEAAKLTGGDAYLSNVMMACNYLVGRGKQSDVGEEEDVMVAPSSALSGLVYQTLMSQVAAGRKFGALNEVDAVKFSMKKSEIAQLEKAGLIPMVNEYGKVMPFSAKTLFNGDNLGLQTYSVVRVFDHITKVLIDFLNRRAFENFNSTTRQDIQKQIIKFLDSVTGPGKLIEKFKLLRFEQDPNQKDRIYLDIHMTPYFPAKNFMIKLDGQKGDDPDSAEWKAEYEQNK